MSVYRIVSGEIRPRKHHKVIGWRASVKPAMSSNETGTESSGMHKMTEDKRESWRKVRDSGAVRDTRMFTVY